MTQPNEALIRVENLHKVFITEEVETHALAGIHLSVNQGEYVSIAGPSGSSPTRSGVGRESGVELGAGGRGVRVAVGRGAAVGSSGPAVALSTAGAREAVGEAPAASVGGRVPAAGVGAPGVGEDGEGLTPGSGVAEGPASEGVGCGEAAVGTAVAGAGPSVGPTGAGVRLGAAVAGVTGCPVGVRVGIVWPA